MPQSRVSAFTSAVGSVGGRDGLAAVIATLELISTTSSLVSAVPCFGVIVNCALGLARTIDNMSTTSLGYTRLAVCAAELSIHIENAIDYDTAAIDGPLRVSLTELQMLLSRIVREVDKHLKKSRLNRFLHQSSIAETLDDYMSELDTAWRSFDTACLIALRMKFERQSLYDDRSQVGTYLTTATLPLERYPEDEGAGELDLCALVKYHPNVCVSIFLLDVHMRLTTSTVRQHPMITQIIGHSHPSLAERFYVMETGKLL
ncbi:uncharacterized protein BXZ73DRAFT_51956 [Epithele typhae]|uniref:uncharacterized protein n=1 Tax=Epithele typhae TaxID=378194 RepID=UPI0020089B3A|nr:uncharacterized protein BXZ73DRAFT_51956 [Epithele typhae]KAH9921202.1 hypothetical protein BXZ73DRAFT_51956 [Epithele typhae]